MDLTLHGLLCLVGFLVISILAFAQSRRKKLYLQSERQCWLGCGGVCALLAIVIGVLLLSGVS
jgi:uncharacterized membrane protein YdcZ (DUF606 family)